MTPALFTPLPLRALTARNRLWVAPMCQYSAEAQDGAPTTWHLVHLGSFARGGAGLVMAEATAVVPEGRISPWDVGLWNDDQVAAWQPITAFVRSQGALAAVQLAHAGRKASTHREWSGTGVVPPAEGGWDVVGPSSLAFPGLAQPRALTVAQLDDVVAAFAAAAHRALQAGFQVVEIHGAHGYLLHEFLSPLSNDRTDEYGGSLENRARLLLRVVEAVRAEVGEDVPVLVRLSATDWVEPEGLTLAQTQELAPWLRDAGVDLIDVSTGGNVPGVHIPTGPGYQVPHAQAVREAATIPVSAVGQLVDAHQAEQIVASGQADVVMAGREFMRDPHFAWRAAYDLGVEADVVPPQYRRGTWAARPDLSAT